MSAQPINDLPDDHWPLDTHSPNVVGQPLDPGHIASGTHSVPAGVDPSATSDQRRGDAHCPPVAGGDSADPDHTTDGFHPSSVGVSDSVGSGHGTPATHGRTAAADALLLICADALDDLERVRIAMQNRHRTLTQEHTVHENGGVSGKSMAGTPAADRMAQMVDAIAAIEHGAELELKRTLRAHPLGTWVKAQRGVGEKTAARLLASIGWPTRRADGTPRTLAQLRSYCGYGDAATQVRRKGVKANWNTTAKMRAYLVAEAAVKAGVRKKGEPDDTDGYDVDAREAISPLGQVYLDARRKYLHATHDAPCPRCGPKGSPAQPGSPLSGAHQQARALRAVSKAMLADLWREADRIEVES